MIFPNTILQYYPMSQLPDKNATAGFSKGEDADTHGDMYVSTTTFFALDLFFFLRVYRWGESIRIWIGLLVMTRILFSFALGSPGSLLLRTGYA